MKLDRRSIYTIIRPHANFQPNPRTFSGHILNNISEVPRARASVVGLRTDNGRNEEAGIGASFKTWWCNAHDDMTRCNTQANDMATTANNWTTPGATVSRRYNTPPLREDLVPRSRMAPEGKQKRKRRGKTKLLLWQLSETKEPCEVVHIERKNTAEMNKVENTPFEKSNEEEQIRAALRLKNGTSLD